MTRNALVIVIVGPPLSIRMPTNEHCRKENSGAELARTGNLLITVQTLF